MKKIVFQLSLLFTSIICLSQSPNISWIKQIQSDESDESVYGEMIITDKEKNVYVAGELFGSIDIDPGEDEIIIDDQSWYFSKFDENGEFIWSITLDEGYALYGDMVVDDDLNFYILGYIFEPVDFDSGEGELIVDPGISQDCILAKYNNDGDVIWVKTLGSETGGGSINHGVINHSDELLITGTFDGEIDFDPGPDVQNREAIDNDIFFGKYSLDGELIWVKTIGGDGLDIATSIASTHDNDFYITGSYRSDMDCDPDGGTYYLVGYFDNDNAFIIKYDTDGILKWAKAISGDNDQRGHSIVTDENENIFSLGDFKDDTDLDPDMSTEFIVTAKGISDDYILMLDSLGTFQWANRIVHNSSIQNNVISVDIFNNVYVAGAFGDTIYPDLFSDTVFYVGLCSSTDGYLVKYNSDGSFIWLNTISSIVNCRNTELSVTRDGEIFCTGDFVYSADFQSGDSVITLDAGVSLDAFFLKFDPCIDISFDTTVSFLENTLHANEDYANYQWLICEADLSPIPGATDQDYSPEKNGEYAVAIETEGCIKISDCIALNLVSINSPNIEHSIQVYPIPADAFITINFPAIISNMQVEILSSSGQILKSLQVNNRIDISDLDDGIYFLRLDGRVEKIIKM